MLVYAYEHIDFFTPHLDILVIIDMCVVFAAIIATIAHCVYLYVGVCYVFVSRQTHRVPKIDRQLQS